MYKGQLTKWNEDRGFGFIKTPDLKSDTFIHISALKHMSRKPQVGDFIHFDVTESNGKKKAINARIEGVSTVSKPVFKRSHKKQSKFSFLFIAIVIVFAFQGIQRLFEKPNDSSQTPLIQLPFLMETESNQNFSCDGRQHCSQMTSRAEAEYFLRNCPNTKMDGDRDGIPCERQRF
ncbi:cold shock domain-containing protein [Aliiglaciecola aliphaticivorans]